MEVQELEAHLERLGACRRELHWVSDRLADAIRVAVADSLDVLPITEIARKLGVDRSTLYRVYMDSR
jgi:DNA invertase Pin-like site-specific DNA recombinase